MDLLKGAVASGIVSPGVARPCMAEILRSGKARQTGKQTSSNIGSTCRSVDATSGTVMWEAIAIIVTPRQT